MESEVNTLDWRVFFSGASGKAPKGQRGVGIGFRLDVGLVFIEKVAISERLMRATFAVQGCKLHVIAAYAPTDAGNE